MTETPPLLVVVLSGVAGPWGCPEEESPLALAETPALDALAAGGRVLGARLARRPDEATGATPLLCVLGLDPARHERARAAWLGALLRTAPGPDEVLVAADFVALFRDFVADAAPGPLEPAETGVLLAAAGPALAEHGITLFSCAGSHHLGVAPRDAIDAALPAPESLLGRRLADFAPAVPAHRAAHRAGREALDGHEINVVRRDLGRNGADMVWLWGPGGIGRVDDRPAEGATAAFGTDPVWRGLHAAAGTPCEPLPDDPDAAAAALAAALRAHATVYVHDGRGRRDAGLRDRGARVAGVTALDAGLVAPARAAAAEAGARLLVLPDVAFDTDAGLPLADPVPVLIAGEGITPLMERPFTEAGARSAGAPVEPGHGLPAYVRHL